MRPRSRRLLLGGRRVRYLFNADFPRYPDQGPPLTSPLQAVPGPGSLGLPTASDWKLAAGALQTVVSGNKTAHMLGGSPIVRADSAGVAVLSEYGVVPAGVWHLLAGFLRTSIDYAGNADNEDSLWINTSYQLQVATGGALGAQLGVTPSAGELYGVVLRPLGAFYIGSGELLWVEDGTSTASLYPALNHTTTTSTTTKARLIDLPGSGYRVWSEQYGIAASRSTNPPAGHTQAAPDDQLTFLRNITLPATGGYVKVILRKQDNLDYVILEFNYLGDVNLKHFVGGVEKTLIGGVGLVTSGDDIAVRLNGSDGKLWAGSTLVGTNTGVSTFPGHCEVTVLNTGGAIGSLEVYPVDLRRYLPKEAWK